MCDRLHYEDMEKRVDELDNRLTRVETSLDAMRGECREGFTDIKAQLNNIYAERREWGKWARDHLGKVIIWACGLIAFACGMTKLPEIVRIFVGATGGQS